MKAFIAGKRSFKKGVEVQVQTESQAFKLKKTSIKVIFHEA
jgi:hypothetical protein